MAAVAQRVAPWVDTPGSTGYVAPMLVPKYAVIVALLGTFVACGDEAAGPRAPWPAWTLGHWVWEDESTQQSAIALVEDYRRRNIPVDAIIIDSPWETGYNTFRFDPVRYPDPQGMVDRFHALGVRVLLWIVPAVNVDVQPIYDDAAAAGHFMQSSETSGPAAVDWWKGRGSLIDYWNPDAVSWWHDLMQPILDLGIDGWKTDGLDFSAWLARYSPGLGRKVLRSEYSDAYYGDFFDHTRARLGPERLIMSRPVDNYGLGLGGEEVAFTPREITYAGWVGDQDASFVGLRHALNNLYHSAALGYVVIGSDIGGYRDQPGTSQGRDEELFVRWTQLGAFCPLMENGGGGEHRPWMFSAETEAIYRKYVRMHGFLHGYLTRHGAAAHASGEPLMRFFSDETYEYLLGPDLFVAPMLEPGAQRDVLFPRGDDWIWLFGDEGTYRGGSREVLTVELADFPAFVRVDSELADLLARVRP